METRLAKNNRQSVERVQDGIIPPEVNDHVPQLRQVKLKLVKDISVQQKFATSKTIMQQQLLLVENIIHHKMENVIYLINSTAF